MGVGRTPMSGRSAGVRRPRPPASPAQRAGGERPYFLTISEDAAFRYAALHYDPKRLTRRAARRLAETLQWFGIISESEHAALADIIDPLGRGLEERDREAATFDMIALLEARLDPWDTDGDTHANPLQPPLDALRRVHSLRHRLPPAGNSEQGDHR
jgi:hypothetical protein